MGSDAGGTAQEFIYRLPGKSGGSRPGAHRSRSVGPGQSFATHLRLFDQPDPRRLDLRASVRNVRGDWLVQAHWQRVSVAVQIIVDVSASMHFGSRRRKLDVVADFVESLGHSAFRSGDSVGMTGFDDTVREDLFMPARSSRGVGSILAAQLRACLLQPGPLRADQPKAVAPVLQCAQHVGGRAALVFLVSDFHWPLDPLPGVLDQLSPALVVPLVVWDPAEVEPPAANRWLTTTDVESGQRHTLWLRASTRAAWRRQVAERRAGIDACCATRDVYPFELQGRFDADALSRHFIETVT